MQTAASPDARTFETLERRALATAGSGTRLPMLGVRDEFPVAGSLDFLLEKYGLTPTTIAESVASSLASAERVASNLDMDCTGGLG